MSMLYPRLPHLVALELFEKLRTLDPADAALYASGTHKATFFAPTGGNQVALAQLDALRVAVVDLAASVGFPARASQASRSEFDQACAEYLLANLDLLPAEAAAREVWAFFGTLLLPDVVLWRFPSPPVDRMLGTDLRRHAFARLWWRAWTLQDRNAPDHLYLFRNLTEDDHVHLFEPTTLGGSPELARSLARCILRDAHRQARDITRRELVRDALKQTLRLTPFLAFESIDAADREEILGKIFEDTEAALLASPPSPEPGVQN